MGSDTADRSASGYSPGAPYSPTPGEAEWVKTATWAEVIDMLGKSAPHLAMGSYRWYLAPYGLIKPDEIPGQWGLLEPIGTKGGLRKVRQAQRYTEWNMHAEQRILININSDWRLIAETRARTLDNNGIEIPKVRHWLTDRSIEQRLG